MHTQYTLCRVAIRSTYAASTRSLAALPPVFTRSLVCRGHKQEKARLRMYEGERFFGAQIATKAISEALHAAEMAAEAGASFVDLNCGCPIHEASRRGLGAIMLRKPNKVAKLVAGIAKDCPLPFTVKIRLGAP